MKILFAGYDLGAQKNFELMVEEAKKRGHEPILLRGEDVSSEAAVQLLLGTKVLITGCASFKKLPELELGSKAQELGIPWVRFADVHYVWNLTNDLVDRYDSVPILVPVAGEVDQANLRGFENVKHLCEPPMWAADRNIQPAQLPQSDSNTVTVMVCGVKDGKITNQMLEEVLNALKALGRYRLIFKTHPKEELSEDSKRQRDRACEGISFLDVPVRPTNIMPSVDICVFTGGATDTIINALLRLGNAIYFSSDAVEARLADQQAGINWWFTAKTGCCLIARKDWVLPLIRSVLSEKGRQKLRTRQATTYPDPPKGEDPAVVIVDYLETLV